MSITVADLVKGTNALINVYNKYRFKCKRRIFYINEIEKKQVINFLKDKGSVIIDLDNDFTTIFNLKIEDQNKKEYDILIKRKYKETMFSIFCSSSNRVIYISSNKETMKALFKPKRIKWFCASSIFKTTHTTIQEDLSEILERKKTNYNSEEDLLNKIDLYINH